MINSEKAGWTVNEWGKSASLSTRTVFALISDSKVKSIKIGRRRVIIESPADFLARMAR